MMLFKRLAEPGKAPVLIVKKSLPETFHGAWRSYRNALVQSRALVAYELLGISMPVLNGALWGVMIEGLGAYSQAAGILALIMLLDRGLTSPLQTMARLVDLRDQSYAREVEREAQACAKQVQLRQIRFHRKAEHDFLISVALMALIFAVSTGWLLLPPAVVVVAYAAYWFFVSRSDMRSVEVGREGMFGYYARHDDEHEAQYRFIQELTRTLAVFSGLGGGWFLQQQWWQDQGAPALLMLGLLGGVCLLSHTAHKLLERAELQGVVEIVDTRWFQNLPLPGDGVFGDEENKIYVRSDSATFSMLRKLIKQGGYRIRHRTLGVLEIRADGLCVCRQYYLGFLSKHSEQRLD
jgi:hypothetical protein